MEFYYEVYKPQNWGKKKEERKNTDNICILGTNIRLNQNHHLYCYQVTKALGLLLIIRKGRCNFLLPVH
jgi:hypothetical protein